VTAEDSVSGSFEAALEYIRRWTGISLPETKYRPLREYLAEFPDSTGFGKIAGELERNAEERERFLSIVTINETYFFREQRQFSLLQSVILPRLVQGGKPILIWSAACATGEEAVSLAALGRSFTGPDGLLVYAGDISPQALARCIEGRYGLNSFRDDGKDFTGLLERFIVREGRDVVVGDELRQSLRYSALNLASRSYPDVPDGLHLVFLRNALMYMPMETRLAVVARVAAKLADNGCLFFSSSELPHLSHPDLALEEHGGVYYFRKKSLAEKRLGSTVSHITVQPHAQNAPRLENKLDSRGQSSGDRGQSMGLSPTRIALYATQRLNNPLFEEPEMPEYQAAVEYLQLIYDLRTRSDIIKSLDSTEAHWGVNALSRYLAGISAQAGSAQAESAFRKALKLEPGFWPARLKLALDLRAVNPVEARSEFKRCTTDIEAYLAAGRYEYQFILEGFNAKYFLDLCNGWARKLGSEGVVHGSR
jgi:chemotaxis protein methyltransferase CheR